MDSDYLQDHHNWSISELGRTHLIQFRYSIKESSQRALVLHVLLLDECDVCELRISISSMEMGIKYAFDTCLLQDVMENKI